MTETMPILITLEEIGPTIITLSKMHPDPNFHRYVAAAMIAQQLGVTLPTGLKYFDDQR